MTTLLYFAMHELHYSEEEAMTTSLPRIILLYREHVDQNTPMEKRQIVDLWTEETIDNLVKTLKKPIKQKPANYIYIEDNYMPILSSSQNVFQGAVGDNPD